MALAKHTFLSQAFLCRTSMCFGGDIVLNEGRCYCRDIELLVVGFFHRINANQLCRVSLDVWILNCSYIVEWVLATSFCIWGHRYVQEKVITTGRVLGICRLDCSGYLRILFCFVILTSKETGETWVEIFEKQNTDLFCLFWAPSNRCKYIFLMVWVHNKHCCVLS